MLWLFINICQFPGNDFDRLIDVLRIHPSDKLLIFMSWMGFESTTFDLAKTSLVLTRHESWTINELIFIAQTGFEPLISRALLQA